jgi:predicted hotdog family 3-hydroxylacyl-ACP dehydratase
MIERAYTVADLLPHRPPAILIDGIEGWEEKGVAVWVKVAPESRFSVAGRGVPSYVGLEYMAQAAGIYAGRLAREAGAPVRIGYLLGTRNFHAAADWFSPGMRLVVHAAEVLRDDPVGVFSCRIEAGGRMLASADLNVYQPPEP